MMKKDNEKTCIVMGSTGRQGGAVLRALLEKGRDPAGPFVWRIVALTRDPSQASVQPLRDIGCIIEKADSNDGASLEAVLHKYKPYAMFCVTNPFTSRWGSLSRPGSTNTELEYQQGLNFVAAAKAAGVQHIVYSSVASAHDSDPDGKGAVEVLATKARVETLVVESGIPYSVVCPTGFFEMLLSNFAGLKQGSVPGLLREGVQVQMMSYHDVGFFVRMMLEDPREWLGRRLEVAGDVTNSWAMAETLSRLRGGEKWTVRSPPEFLLKLFIPKALNRMYVSASGHHPFSLFFPCTLGCHHT